MNYINRVVLVSVVVWSTQVNAWQRTKCGPGDQVTSWGLKVDPSNLLKEHPRPQFERPTQFSILNGLWQYQFARANDPIPYNKTLTEQILVPFPPEACLSGVGATPPNYYSFYRIVFDAPFTSATTLLHFGAVDWNCSVYLNGVHLGNHSGGYTAFSFDVSTILHMASNELIVRVYDPSDTGAQPNGKQRISAITNPSGDTYTPSSGIWQTVWLEAIPTLTYISSFRMSTTMSSVSFNISVVAGTSTTPVNVTIFDAGGATIATGSGTAGQPLVINIPNPQLWNVASPYLYTAQLAACTVRCDTVNTYFGLRVVGMSNYTTPGTPPTGPQTGIDRGGGDLPGSPFDLPSADPNLCWGHCNQTANCVAWAYAIPNCDGYAQPTCWLKGDHQGTSKQQCRISGDQGTKPGPGRRPTINGKYTFLAAWLDQSWFPDGQYTAPSDDALAFDVQAVQTFGLNAIRLHQKINSERWYYYADKLGIAVQQDFPQKYGGASKATIPYFMSDVTEIMAQLYNHPSIFQWTVFNEGDEESVFDIPGTTRFVQQLDPSRLVDTNSGGPGNDLHIADVNDIHSYPYPGHPVPSATQYAEIGEYGGLGAFIAGHEWVPNQCTTYLHTPTTDDMLNTYVNMTKDIIAMKGDVSFVVYTQITDVERECDGWYNMDRTNKLNDAQMATIVRANQAMITNN